MKTQLTLATAGLFCLGLLTFSCQSPTQLYSIYPEGDFSAAATSLETNAAALTTLLREQNVLQGKTEQLMNDILQQSRQLQEAGTTNVTWGREVFQQYIEARCRKNCPPGPLPCDVGSCPELLWQGKFSFLLPATYRNARIRIEQAGKTIAESKGSPENYAPGLVALPVERTGELNPANSTVTVHVLPGEGSGLQEEMSFEMPVQGAQR